MELDEVHEHLERITKNAFHGLLSLHLERKVSVRLAANMPDLERAAEAVAFRGQYP